VGASTAAQTFVIPFKLHRLAQPTPIAMHSALRAPAARLAGPGGCALRQHRSLSSAAPAPTTFEELYGAMQGECRGELAAYGACLGRSLETLSRGVCAAEFAALRACSDATLARVRSAKRAAAAPQR
jgi:hypothetical protein